MTPAGAGASEQPGMVFALEPKFVLPGLGAIGFENTWLVIADGLTRLTEALEHIRVAG
jgi:Xaa-Pro aminopeptidase